MKARILNIVHSILSPKSHAKCNEGFIDELANSLREKDLMWPALLWCPVCTVIAIWRFLTHGKDVKKE